MHLPLQLINIAKSFLANRTFQIKSDQILSTIRPIQAKVPQGSCLSRNLFLIYDNDMPRHKDLQIALFADDTLFDATAYRLYQR